MARAAGQKQSKRGKRRADALTQRAARARAKRARGAGARSRATAKKRATRKRTVRTAVRKLKRAVARRVVRAKVKRGVKALRTRAAAARKRVTAAAKRGVKTLRQRSAAAKKRVQRGAKAVRKRVSALGKNVSRRVERARSAVRRAVVVSNAQRSKRRGPVEAAAPVPEAFARQRASATPREQLLFELQRARASVKAATQGLSSGTAEQPIKPGKWSIKEIVLHLSERDRVRLEEFARTLGGQPRSWAGIEDPEMGVYNEAHLAPLRAHSWDDALRRLDTMREQLLLRLSQVPAEPDDVWQKGHPFGDMMWNLPDHDRHHARQIKQARIGAASPAEV